MIGKLFRTFGLELFAIIVQIIIMTALQCDLRLSVYKYGFSPCFGLFALGSENGNFHLF